MIFFKNIHFLKNKALILISMCCLLFTTGCTQLNPAEIALWTKINEATCWPCTLYAAVWEAIGFTVEELLPSCASMALDTLGIALSFWLAFTVLKLASSIKAPKISDFSINIATVCFKAVIVAVILMNNDYMFELFDTIVAPVMSAFISLSKEILFSESTIAQYFEGFDLSSSINNNRMIFTDEVGNQINDVIFSIYAAFNSGVYLGARIAFTFNIASFFIGIFIMFTFFYLMLFFPLLFAEGFIIFGVIMVLVPFLLVAWVFPSTKQYIKPAWTLLLSSVVQILITCIYIGVLITVVNAYSTEFSISKQLTDPALILGVQNMSNNALGFFALLYCMFKISNDIPNITSIIFNEINRSRIVDMFRGIQKTAQNMGTMAAGVAIGAAGGGAVASAMMNQGAQGLADNMKEIMSGQYKPEEGEGGNANQDAINAAAAQRK